METIFDHGITKREMEILHSFIPTRLITDKSKYMNDIDLNKCLADLYHLYFIRGDNTKVTYYLNKIKNPVYRSLLSSF